MTIFDLLFIAVFFASIGSLITAAVVALRGRRARALGILRRLAVSAIAYLAIVVLVALFSPQRVLNVGDPWCFDDWCLTVESVSQTPAPPWVAYHVSLRIFSRARRVAQRHRRYLDEVGAEPSAPGSARAAPARAPAAQPATCDDSWRISDRQSRDRGRVPRAEPRID